MSSENQDNLRQAANSPSSENPLDKRIADTFERVATTTERVGIPVGTFAAGMLVLLFSSQVDIPLLPWIGASLILAALGTYIWLTERSTTKAQLPPPPIPSEIDKLLNWMKEEQTIQNEWMRKMIQQSAQKKE